VGYLAYGPLAFGLLTGAIRKDTTFPHDDWRAGGMGMGNYERLFSPRARAGNLGKVDRLRPIAERLGTQLATLALRRVGEHRAGRGRTPRCGRRTPERGSRSTGEWVRT